MANISKNARPRWLEHVEKDSRCSNENITTWTRKDRKTKTEVERCYTKIHEGERKREDA